MASNHEFDTELLWVIVPIGLGISVALANTSTSDTTEQSATYFCLGIAILAMLAFFGLYRLQESRQPWRQHEREVSRQRAAELQLQEADLAAQKNVERQAQAGEAEQKRKADEHKRYEEGQRQSARRQAQDFFEQNRDLLRAVWPPALLTAQLNAAIPATATPESAWGASRDVIAQLQAVVAQEKEKLKVKTEREQRRQSRLADLDRRIAAFRKQIDRVRKSPLDRAIADEEVFAMEQSIHQLEEQKAILSEIATEHDA